VNLGAARLNEALADVWMANCRLVTLHFRLPKMITLKEGDFLTLHPLPADAPTIKELRLLNAADTRPSGQQTQERAQTHYSTKNCPIEPSSRINDAAVRIQNRNRRSDAVSRVGLIFRER
jgi:hypothetical protein